MLARGGGLFILLVFIYNYDIHFGMRCEYIGTMCVIIPALNIYLKADAGKISFFFFRQRFE